MLFVQCNQRNPYIYITTISQRKLLKHRIITEKTYSFGNYFIKCFQFVHVIQIKCGTLYLLDVWEILSIAMGLMSNNFFLLKNIKRKPTKNIQMIRCRNLYALPWRCQFYAANGNNSLFEMQMEKNWPDFYREPNSVLFSFFLSCSWWL